MEKQTFHVPNISCWHCIAAIKRGLKALPGVNSIEGSPDSKKIDVEWEPPATSDTIKKTLVEMNYPAD